MRGQRIYEPVEHRQYPASMVHWGLSGQSSAPEPLLVPRKCGPLARRKKGAAGEPAAPEFASLIMPIYCGFVALPASEEPAPLLVLLLGGVAFCPLGAFAPLEGGVELLSVLVDGVELLAGGVDVSGWELTPLFAAGVEPLAPGDLPG